jgi:hypothetical protein
MVAEVVLSVMGNRSDRRFPNLSCPWALEAAEVTRRRRADFHQGPERTMKLLKQAEYMAATGFTFHPTIAFRSGLGPYKGQAFKGERVTQHKSLDIRPNMTLYELRMFIVAY